MLTVTQEARDTLSLLAAPQLIRPPEFPDCHGEQNAHLITAVVTIHHPIPAQLNLPAHHVNLSKNRQNPVPTHRVER